MGLFDKLIHGNKIEIGSPVNGEIVPIGQVGDETFSQEMIGKGVAVMPSDGKFYAPADGTLESLFPTGHAFCINTKDGVELLVHIGIDTVNLNGEHFTIRSEQGAQVKKGDLIVEMDVDAVKNAGYDVITPVVILNHDSFKNLEKKNGTVSAGDAVILLEK